MFASKRFALSACTGLLATLGACAPAAAAEIVAAAEVIAATTELPVVEVVGTTPLPGVGLPREKVPAPVQSATGADIDRSNALDLSDYLNRTFGSVYINEMQGNPFQPDVNYRGYTASPLLGTPQGLSVFLDGVRLNQPFGDVVSWDLIPKSAIASVNLIPGSNPLFGLNTLGGALSIQTKDGRSNPGNSIQATAGNYGRVGSELQLGGFDKDRGFDWFVTGNLFHDGGWRENSPSRVGQLFSKLGWHDAQSSVTLTYAFAETQLYGNGLQDQRLLDQNYASVYTKPDITQNRSTFLNLAGSHSASDSLILSGNVYYRWIRTTTFNGDLNDDSLTESVYQLNAAERTALTAAGYTGLPPAVPAANSSNTPFPYWRCIASTLIAGGEPNEKCNGLLTSTQTTQSNYGLSGQFTLLGALAGHANQLTAGAAADHSEISFQQTRQFGYLNPDRSVTGVNAFANGTAFDDDGNLIDGRVSLDGHIRTWSTYATDTLSIREVWHLTLSGRYNRTSIRNSDNINPGGGPRSLDGDYTYSRFNPAIGLSVTPSKVINAYVGYNEGSRAPTAIELGCANPAQPCRLPNSMAGDPPLEQVVTKTWEAGVRGVLANVRWNAGVFRAENDNDILFVAAPNTLQSGYFKNFGKTRRQGIELGVGSAVGRLALGANYSYIDATFQSPETLAGDSNSGNSLANGATRGTEGGTIQVTPGNRIPLVPQHLFKAFADYTFTPALSANANLIAVGSSYARGNENNAQQSDGTYYLGNGRSGGYAVMNLGTQYQADRQLRLIGQVNNLFDRQYATASVLGPTGFTAGGNYIARTFPGNSDAIQHATFYSPGAPRTWWIGLRYLFDAPVRSN